jgi:hypothetical protein
MLMMLISWTTGIQCTYAKKHGCVETFDIQVEASKHAIPNHNALPFHKTAEGQYPYPFEKELGCMTRLDSGNHLLEHLKSSRCVAVNQRLSVKAVYDGNSGKTFKPRIFLFLAELHTYLRRPERITPTCQPCSQTNKISVSTCLGVELYEILLQRK